MPAAFAGPTRLCALAALLALALAGTPSYVTASAQV
jgi:hypothetical protein